MGEGNDVMYVDPCARELARRGVQQELWEHSQKTLWLQDHDVSPFYISALRPPSCLARLHPSEHCTLPSASMVRSTAIAAAVVALAVQADAAGLYPKSSKVLQVTTADYDRLIAKSNYTSIVE